MTKELINKYFTGDCSPEEKAQVVTYLEGDDLQLLHDYMDEIDRISNDRISIDKNESDNLLQSIHKSINTEEVIKHIQAEVAREFPEVVETGDTVDTQTLPQTQEQDSGKRKLYKFLPMRIAASFALLCSLAGGGYFSWKYYNEINTPSRVIARIRTVDNPTINIKKIKMSDGTTIWLNAHSSFSFDSDTYNKAKREITIHGEAYFDVAHNAKKPFVVRSGEISTIVLGTAFNVEAYENEKNIRVILVRGKVKVQTAEQQQILVPGQMIDYSIATHNLSVREMETKDVSSWTNGNIVFNDITLADAFNRMEQLFGIEIQFTTKPGSEEKRLTGVFDRKSPEEVLKQVLFVHGLSYTKKGGRFIIK